ncbi:Cytochrome P450 monooxygenase [Pseudocercospora fuligena]|uniref:Cytochrome P450 monooxygenase n=1 Tax=Pseudocercospora fuligena TaxID=685502 RepID=A0A8H6RFJ5_9PEZI|nr:Cytochrome P450 monooxygenase [Pseudocercospora fuligena]
MAFTLQDAAIAASIICLAGWLAYRALLPKPIPGIPYDEKSARRILGDIPDAMKHRAETKELLSFLSKRIKELDSPIIQLSMRPFGGRPWVIINDGREAQDILVRRGREFDRSDFFRMVFEQLFPKNQGVMYTNDEWRHNRRLMADAMSPNFLNNTAAHKIHENTLDLIELWQHRMRLAKGRPFEVMADVTYTTVDTIWAACFGHRIGAAQSQSDFLSKVSSIELPSSTDEIAAIPDGPLPEVYVALKDLADSAQIPMNSMFGQKAHWFALNFYPSLRRALVIRDKLVYSKLDEAWKTFDGGRSDAEIKCVVDLVVQRETNLAKKENRPVERNSRNLFDEVAGFLNAGQDTTSSTLSWGMKYLTKHQDVQNKVRDALKTTFEEAAKSGRQLEAEEIAKAKCPYLDAFVEEVLRHSGINPANMRVALQDAQLLGHVIPKGTDVFMMTSGPSYHEPPMPLDEKLRSGSSREQKGDSERFEWKKPSDLDEFKPERWLVPNDKGGLDHNSRAAPMQIFGLGIRGCYGKRLAYLEMRVIYALVLWNFELLPIADSIGDFKGTDVMSHQPQHVRIRLAPVQRVL